MLPTCMAGAGVLGLCLWAYAGWWLVLAVCSVGQTLRQGIPFTLGGCSAQLSTSQQHVWAAETAKPCAWYAPSTVVLPDAVC